MLQLYIIRHAQSQNNALWLDTGDSYSRYADPLLTDVGHKQAWQLAQFLVRDPDQGNLVESDSAKSKESRSLAQNEQGSSIGGRGRDPLQYNRFGFTHLYCSLMQRAIQTGLYLAEALDLPLIGRLEIHERGGIYQSDESTGEAIGLPGMGRAMFRERYPELLLPDEFGSGGWWDRPYESLAQAEDRARQVVKWLFDVHGHGHDRVALITHGGFFNPLLLALTDLQRVFPAGSPATGDEKRRSPDFWFQLHNCSITRLDLSEDYRILVYMNRVDFLDSNLIT